MVHDLLMRRRVVNLTVLVEQIDERKYRAETSQPISLVTEGSSREEAVERLRQLAKRRLASGEMVQIVIPEVLAPHPWLPYAGIWKDNPDIDSFLENVAAYRRRVDEAESRS